jgi:hypothetical protein
MVFNNCSVGKDSEGFGVFDSSACEKLDRK